ncbi:smad nuclear interacting protein 1-like [Chelonus insularis]|uniref:smad nuclear interacting protein 1-like n=1 Tax=Chelonus insularis TaxID=460826 RepID=UPI001589BBAA|nr:smad nuclear interacting protein 1-like [Chelonus insularis]XP_034935505.1 smad nuclear interacting protein 1-like [Chelonus insularis]
MAGHNDTYRRDRDRRRHPRNYDNESNRRDKYHERYNKLKDRNSRSLSPCRRDRSHYRDEEKPKRFKYDDRRHNDDFKNTKNHQNKFDMKIKKESFSPEWGSKSKDSDKKSNTKPQEKEKPSFALSGKLAEDTNTINGVVIKYSEPDDAKKPKKRWRLYPFKGEKELPVLHIHRQSAYLMGRDRKIADIPLDHPSCSKQHAVLQFRIVPFTRENGSQGRRIRPYLIDLDSANGTFVNNVKLEGRRYHELLERDVLKFGYSTREYVLLHEHSKDDEADDDLPVSSET